MAAFDIFNHPYRIIRVVHTEATRDQITGVYVEESESEVDIAGSFDNTNVITQNHSFEGLDSGGSPVFYTQEELEINDRLRVFFDDLETKSQSYRVTGIVEDASWIGSLIDSSSNRRQYELELEEPDY